MVITGFHDILIIITSNSKFILNSILFIPKYWDERILFIKHNKETNKFLKGRMLVDTNIGYADGMFAFQNSQFEDGFRGMIDHMLANDYRSIIGYVKDGKIIMISDNNEDNDTEKEEECMKIKKLMK